MDEKSSKRLVLAANVGTFRATRLSLGLITSWSECCHAIQKVLEGLPDQHLSCYMDGVAVHHTSLDSLILLKEELLIKIRTFGLR